MSNVVVKQPDGRYAIFDSGTVTIIIWDATGAEIEGWFVEKDLT